MADDRFQPLPPELLRALAAKFQQNQPTPAHGHTPESAERLIDISAPLMLAFGGAGAMAAEGVGGGLAGALAAESPVSEGAFRAALQALMLGGVAGGGAVGLGLDRANAQTGPEPPSQPMQPRAQSLALPPPTMSRMTGMLGQPPPPTAEETNAAIQLTPRGKAQSGEPATRTAKKVARGAGAPRIAPLKTSPQDTWQPNWSSRSPHEDGRAR